MYRFVLTRLLLIPPIVVGITAASFFVLNVLPGDAATLMGAEGIAIDAATLERIRTELGLDRPLYEQYGSWLWGIVQGDFGESLALKVDIFPEMMRAMATTFQLATLSIAFGVVVGVTLGALAATRGGWIDSLVRFLVSIGIGIPGFVIATLLILFVAPLTPWLPTFNFVTFSADPIQSVAGMVLPTIAVGMAIAMIVSENTRAALLEVGRENYVALAYSKGLSRRQVLISHMMKNASIPVITVLGLQASFVFSSSILVEVIFGLPGMGRLVMLGISLRDPPLVQGVLVATAVAVLLISLVADLLYAAVDPRVRFGRDDQ